MSNQPIHHAVYLIRNNGYSSGGLLGLASGYRKYNNAAAMYADASDVDHFKQLWLLKSTGQNDWKNRPTFQIQCVQAGAFLVATAEGNNNTAWAWGTDKYADNSQYWAFEAQGNDQYIIINAATGGSLGANEKEGNWLAAAKTGYAAEENNNHTWTLTRRSRGSSEIGAMLEKHPDINPDTFRHFLSDGSYLTLPDAVRNDIWQSSLLGKKFYWRSEIFDCDDFAFTMKAEVGKWGNDNIRAEDVAILMGILYGDSPGGAHAFNWYLKQDLSDLKFFEPQQNKEDDKALGYKGYFGVY